MEPTTRTSTHDPISRGSDFENFQPSPTLKKSYSAMIIQFDLINFFTFFCISSFDLIYNFLNQNPDTEFHLGIYIFPLAYSGICLLIAIFLLIFRDRYSRRHPNKKWCSDPTKIKRTLKLMQIILFFYMLELSVLLLKSDGDIERTNSGEKNIIF